MRSVSIPVEPAGGFVTQESRSSTGGHMFASVSNSRAALTFVTRGLFVRIALVPEAGG